MRKGDSETPFSCSEACVCVRICTIRSQGKEECVLEINLYLCEGTIAPNRGYKYMNEGIQISQMDNTLQM